jgi:hypothetical protein
VGEWSIWPQGYGHAADKSYQPPNAPPGRSASWTFKANAPGRWRVSADWTGADVHASRARYSLSVAGKPVATAAIDQRQAPKGGPTLDGWAFQPLFTFDARAGDAAVLDLQGDGDGFVNADAAYFELVTPAVDPVVVPDPPVVVPDPPVVVPPVGPPAPDPIGPKLDAVAAKLDPIGGQLDSVQDTLGGLSTTVAGLSAALDRLASADRVRALMAAQLPAKPVPTAADVRAFNRNRMIAVWVEQGGKVADAGAVFLLGEGDAAKAAEAARKAAGLK